MRTEYDEVKEILVKHDVDLAGDIDYMMETIVYEEPLFQELFEYFIGDMPYDVAKGRADLMSDEWILDRVQALGLIKEPEEARPVADALDHHQIMQKGIVR